MSIRELEKDQIVLLPDTSFSDEGIKERQDLQRIFKLQIEVLDPNLLVIGEEYGDWEESQRRIATRPPSPPPRPISPILPCDAGRQRPLPPQSPASPRSAHSPAPPAPNGAAAPPPPASALAPPGSRAAPRRARGAPPPRANAESAPRSLGRPGDGPRALRRHPVLRGARWPVVPGLARHRTSASRVRREGWARQLRCVKLDVSRPTQPPRKQMPARMSLSIGAEGFRVVV